MLQQLKNTLLASGFNECILLFSDLPDIVMETCVNASQRMYASTPKSISFRQHVRHSEEPGEFDIATVPLAALQAEMCPRISARDVLRLVRERGADGVVVLDLRSASEYRRAHLGGSVNVPFAVAQAALSDGRLETLAAVVEVVPHLQARLAGRIVVVCSCVHENTVLVRCVTIIVRRACCDMYLSIGSFCTRCPGIWSTAAWRMFAPCTTVSTSCSPLCPTFW